MTSRRDISLFVDRPVASSHTEVHPDFSDIIAPPGPRILQKATQSKAIEPVPRLEHLVELYRFRIERQTESCRIESLPLVNSISDVLLFCRKAPLYKVRNRLRAIHGILKLDAPEVGKVEDVAVEVVADVALLRSTGQLTLGRAEIIATQCRFDLHESVIAGDVKPLDLLDAKT